jgi:hypothetical protein
MAHTLVPQVHLHFQGLELIGQAGAGLGTHLLVGPLLQAIELLVDVHGCGWWRKCASLAWRC